MIERISYEEVTNIANSLHTSAEAIKSILNETSKKMATINTEDTWKSQAASDLYEKYNVLASKFEMFYTAIENYARFLQQTVATYQAADKTISSKVDEILNS